MTELQCPPGAAMPPGGPGLQAAWRLVQAAERAATVGHDTLSWANLRAWPAWALAGPPPSAWLCVAGACWHATEIKQCIDGARLQALRDLLGAPAFAAVLRLEEPSPASPLPRPPHHPLLTQIHATEPNSNWGDQLQSTGRLVALASLAEPELRAAVAAALAWPAAHTAGDESRPRAALTTALPEALPTALPSALAQAWLTLATEHVRS